MDNQSKERSYSDILSSPSPERLSHHDSKRSPSPERSHRKRHNDSPESARRFSNKSAYSLKKRVHSPDCFERREYSSRHSHHSPSFSERTRKSPEKEIYYVLESDPSESSDEDIDSNSEIKKYHEEERVLLEKWKKYYDDPETHPHYEEQWTKFWLKVGYKNAKKEQFISIWRDKLGKLMKDGELVALKIKHGLPTNYERKSKGRKVKKAKIEDTQDSDEDYSFKYPTESTAIAEPLRTCLSCLDQVVGLLDFLESHAKIIASIKRECDDMERKEFGSSIHLLTDDRVLKVMCEVKFKLMTASIAGQIVDEKFDQVSRAIRTIDDMGKKVSH